MSGPVDVLSQSMPQRIWLQVDVGGDPDDYSEPMPRDAWDDLTWHYEPIGGQEIEYIRTDYVDGLIDKARAIAEAVEFRIDDKRAAMLDELREAIAAVGGAK